MAAAVPARAQDVSAAGLYGPSDATGARFSRIQTLIRAGVLDLAQSLLETQGPDDPLSDAWITWERQLWALLRDREKWQDLYLRTRQLPPSFPAHLRREADLAAVNALNQLERGRQARVLLRLHLVEDGVSEFEKRKFRKALVESYLADGLLAEAEIAMRNYQRDFRAQEEDWLLLSAEIHLRLNDPSGAVNVLAPLDGREPRLLRLYARLRDRSMTPEQALARLDALSGMDTGIAGAAEAEAAPDTADGETATPPDAFQARLRSVAVYAYAQLAAGERLVDALEQYVEAAASGGMNPAGGIWPVYGAVDLLAAYQAVALDEANAAGLLVGEDNRILNHAVGLPPGRPAVKKALYAYLADSARNPALKLQANNFYVSALMQSGRTGLIPVLYGEGRVLGRLTLGGDIGLALSNFALANGDPRLAAEITGALSGAPTGMDEREWLLHGARLSIVAGDHERGAARLMQLVTSYDRLGPEQADAVLQPVFDLQTAERHLLALELLHAVAERAASLRHEREIAYWMAQSHQALGEYIQAADYYLYSALQKDNGYDRWGRAARFQAAESLLAAELAPDARALFEGLLHTAPDEAGKDRIRRRLQELWLIESTLHESDDAGQ